MIYFIVSTNKFKSKHPYMYKQLVQYINYYNYTINIQKTMY